ncbi:hypothetical protein ACJRO7_005656 [Eucalyptus globulus]|uniref:Dof zinc finger protein n=1 Tax=Eucalyptus globulus TaxID=34317 RepID=A0ABD3J2P5_EUCGL
MQQDPSSLFQPTTRPQFPEQEQLKCPRCESTNTKFCYYNNYNLSQPRHFCKGCRRYWTKGGALRNIPVGGGTRKTAKRASSKSKRHNAGSGSDAGADHPQAPGSSQAHSRTAEEASQSPPPGFVGPTLDLDPARFYGSPSDLERRMLDVNGSFSSLLGTSGPFLSILEGPNLNASGASSMVRFGGLGDEVKPGHGHVPGSAREPGAAADGAENFMDIQNGDAGCWTGGSGWPDLAIYTPGSSFHR